MDGSLQNRINPAAGRDNLQISDVKNTNKSQTPSSVDFKSVLMNSNQEVSKQRAAEKNGDLSTASSYEDFLDQFNKQAKNDELPKTSLGKDDFLKLFVTQLKNQDPLKPQDGTEMASQLAQFNSLEQMMNMNTSLEKIEKGNQTARSHQFIDFIGKEVSLFDGRANLKDQKISDVSGYFSYPSVESFLEIKDQTGASIANIALGPKKEGDFTLEWNGKNEKGEKVADGVYTLSLTGKTQTGVPMIGSVKTTLSVTGLDLKDTSAPLQTAVGKVAMDSIGEVKEKQQQDEKPLKHPLAPAPAPASVPAQKASYVPEIQQAS